MTEAEDIRAAVREAHEVLKDLRAERRAVEQLISGITGRVQTEIGARLSSEIEEAVTQLGKSTDAAMRNSVRQVERSFDKLADLYLGRGHPSGESLESATVRLVAARALRRET